MKPPYVRITARCEKHGVFVVEKKPNRTVSTAAPRGTEPSGFYQAVKCPRCPFYAEITQQELIQPEAPPVVEQAEMFGEGACHG